MALNRIDPHNGLWRAAGTLLMPLGALYAAGTRLRSLAYRRGWLTSFPAGVPVVSVGNITAGGTGKTPMVQLLAGWLLEEGLRPAVLSRGYGGTAQGDIQVLEAGSDLDPRLAGDEPCLLSRNLPGVPVLVSPHRVAAARLAVGQLNAGLLLLDDGFQHLRLRRDLDLLLVDASDPLWTNRVIPAGTLREPLSAMSRADAVICTRTPDSGIPRDLARLISHHCPGRPVYSARHAPAGITPLGSSPLPPAGKNSTGGYLLVSGIGNPRSFRRSAEEFGLHVAGEKRFADHHRYRESDLAEVGRLLARLGGDAVLFTEKDAVRLGPLARQLQWPAGFLGVRMAVQNADQLRQLVLDRVRGA